MNIKYVPIFIILNKVSYAGKKYAIKHFQKHGVKNSHFQDNLGGKIELLNFL